MEHDHPVDEIQSLLRLTQAAGGDVEAFARMHLAAFRDACMDAVRWQKTEGRAMVLRGEDPERVREQTEERIGEARQRLRGKLASLMAWARVSGRSQGELDAPTGRDADGAIEEGR